MATASNKYMPNVSTNGRQVTYVHAAFEAKGGIKREDLDDGIQLLKTNDTTCFIHYVIKDNEIYTKGYGKHQVWAYVVDRHPPLHILIMGMDGLQDIRIGGMLPGKGLRECSVIIF